jgi:hypothetical protein
MSGRSDTVSDAVSGAQSDALSDAQSDAVSSDVIQFFTTTINVNKADMDILISRLKYHNILSMDRLISISNYEIKNLRLRAIPYKKLMRLYGKEEPKIQNNISCDCSLCSIEETTCYENSSTVKRFFNCGHVMCSNHFAAMCKSCSNILCPECRASQ